ncbi:MAG TPA: RES domain-containing protein [Longimicrobium sp.]|nr:RES domain-containing protein [Longimicrobium sp.]
MRRVGRGGTYYRVCKAGWTDCGDTSHSQIRGGRWNAPGAHRVLYLNRTIRMAALQAHDNFTGEAHSLFDLRPDRRPHLQGFDVPRADYVDAVTDDGVVALGLPATYPDGIGWDVCQRIGGEAYDGGEPGIACRTACAGGDDPDHEEMALFDRDGQPASPGQRWTFAEWFPTGGI